MKASHWFLAAACALVPVGCSDKQNASASGPQQNVDGGSNSPEASVDNDSGKGSGTVTCGGKECTVPNGGSIERLVACCQDDGTCGLKAPNVQKCLPAHEPSTPGPTCPRTSYKTASGDSYGACCGQSGCGALDPYLGCIPNSALGATEAACTFDPTNDCSSILEIPCDGDEDCGSGKRCCARRTASAYMEVGCFDSCNSIPDAGQPGQWFDLCHTGDTCETAGDQCLASTLLPKPFARCDTGGGQAVDPTANREAGRVSCGANLCGSGEKCCIRPPHDPYCSPVGVDCECKPKISDAGPTTPEAGSSEAGTAEAGSKDASSVPVDAAHD